MSTVALFELAPPTLTLVHSNDTVRERWTADPDDARRVAELLCEQATEDLAGEDAALRWDVEVWFDVDEDGHFAFAAEALGVTEERLEAQIREQAALRRSRACWHRKAIEAAHNPDQGVLPL